MAREGLLFGLRSALHDARKGESAVRREGLIVAHGGRPREVSLEVVPLGARFDGRHYLVLFEDGSTGRAPRRPRPPPGRAPRRLVSAAKSGKADKAGKATEPSREQAERLLREELAASRDYLQSSIQDLEATNEELQSANEEILSSNEELQSTNEELDTAKEELQSTNEELNTINEELSARNEELSRARATWPTCWRACRSRS